MRKPVYIVAPMQNAPNFSEFGLLSLTLLTSWAFFRRLGSDYVLDRIDMPTVQRVADLDWWDNRQSEPIVFDIETVDTRTSDRPLRDHNHDQFTDVINHYRQHARHHHKAMGFYGELPVRDFHRVIKGPASPEYKAWEAENEAFTVNLDDQTLEQRRGVSHFVDRIHPSIYYWYPDRLNEFTGYAEAQIAAAARYGHPVYPFICPQVQKPGFPFWQPGIWADMLRAIYDHQLTDGIVIYVASAGLTWDDSAAWWQETREVLEL